VRREIARVLRNEGCVKSKKRNGFLTFKRENEATTFPGCRCKCHVASQMQCGEMSRQGCFSSYASPTRWGKRRVIRRNARKPFRQVKLSLSLGACVLDRSSQNLGPSIWVWLARLWGQKVGHELGSVLMVSTVMNN